MPTPTQRVQMSARRARVVLSEIRWWSVLALLLGIAAFCVGITGGDFRVVHALLGCAVVTAILSIRET